MLSNVGGRVVDPVQFLLGRGTRWSLVFYNELEVPLRWIYRGFGYTREQPQESNVRVHIRVDAELL